MRTIALSKEFVLWSLMLLLSASLTAQVEKVETFDVGEDVVVEVNTSHTNVVFETWNKDRVQVTARVEGADMSQQELQEILDSWDFEVLGNSEKVVVTSNAANSWFGLRSLEGLKGLKALEGLKGLKGLEDLKGLKGLEALGDMEFDFAFPDMTIDFDIPEVPDYGEFPNWPFSDERPNILKQEGYTNYSFTHNGNFTFNLNEYEADKKAYVARLNKRYGTNVKVKEVDRWLEEVDKWNESFQKKMEEWGANFGKQFEERFGEDFEIKMERWGEEFGEKFGKHMEAWSEEFGKDMEAWGEEFGEKFGKDMEKWGKEFEEKFGKDMEKWAEDFARQFEEDGANFTKKELTDPQGNKVIILKGEKSGNLKKIRANKTLIIKMPKGSKTQVNVRHGELKMANAYNLKATLNYSPFIANSIDGGQTLINAAYGPVKVNNWQNGRLLLKFTDDCVINEAEQIELQANSSNVRINLVGKAARLAGSFGDVQIGGVSSDFDQLLLELDNSDAFVVLPRSSFNFNFNGERSTILYPKSMQLNQRKENGRVLLDGHHQNPGSDRSFVIRARYSNVKMQ